MWEDDSSETLKTHTMLECEVLIPFLGEVSKYLLVQVPQAHVDATAGGAVSRAGARDAPLWDIRGLCDFFGFTNKIIFFLKPLAAPKGVLLSHSTPGST